MSQTATIRQTVGRIRSRNGKDAARVWAESRGYAVSWKGGALTVKPLA